MDTLSPNLIGEVIITPAERYSPLPMTLALLEMHVEV
jgi:hypothetical protein